MLYALRAVAFDLDAASLDSLEEAFPDWEIEVIRGATVVSLAQEIDLGAAALLVLRASRNNAEMLGLCRSLRSQVGWARTPLVVLVGPTQEGLVAAALKAGADCCLVLPVHAKEMAKAFARMHQGNQPGRHTLNLDPAQHEDRWRDDGGQG